MSAYSEIATNFTDGDCLLKALQSMGYSKVKNCIGNPIPLVGYQGDFRTADGNGHTKNPDLAMKGEIVITRQEIGGSSNDIGFTRGKDGTYRAIISDFDSTKHNSAWMSKLKVGYSEEHVKKVAEQQGFTFTGRSVDKVTGKIKYGYIKA